MPLENKRKETKTYFMNTSKHYISVCVWKKKLFKKNEIICLIFKLLYNERPGIWHQTIWWWGFSPGVLGNAEYPLIAITPRFILTRSGSIRSGQIVLFNNLTVRKQMIDVKLNC